MSKELTNYAGHLLSENNPEVKRKFENHFVEQTFRHYLALKVPADDIVKFFHKAQVTGADPIKDQIFLIPRNVNVGKNGRDEWTTVGTVVFSYHFVETKAVESGEYEGYTLKTGVMSYFDPIIGKAKDMLACEAIVVRKGKQYPFTAWWDEYVQTGKYGVTAQWKGKPHLMLEKCAKAGALRAAFPEWLSGAYTQEEMGAIEKEGTETIETTLAENKEVEKVQEIQERIEKKIEIAESMPEISSLTDLIGVRMGIITEGKTIDQKGKAMVKLLGVRKFDELKNKSLDELKAINKNLGGIVEETKARKEKSAKPTFNLENPS